MKSNKIEIGLTTLKKTHIYMYIYERCFKIKNESYFSI